MLYVCATLVRYFAFVRSDHRIQRGIGITYFVIGGGGAHAYPITRAADDPFQSKEANYHYLLRLCQKAERCHRLARWSLTLVANS